MVNFVLTVCILWHLCTIRYPFKLQKTRRTICCCFTGLNVTSAGMKCAVVVSSGLLVLVRLQRGQLFVSYQIKKQTSVGWHSHLCFIKLLECQSFLKLHLSTSREGETGDWEIPDLTSWWMSLNIVSNCLESGSVCLLKALKCWGLWSLGCWGALGV